jgi:hypothetical protein
MTAQRICSGPAHYKHILYLRIRLSEKPWMAATYHILSCLPLQLVQFLLPDIAHTIHAMILLSAAYKSTASDYPHWCFIWFVISSPLNTTINMLTSYHFKTPTPLTTTSVASTAIGIMTRRPTHVPMHSIRTNSISNKLIITLSGSTSVMPYFLSASSLNHSRCPLTHFA